MNSDELLVSKCAIFESEVERKFVIFFERSFTICYFDLATIFQIRGHFDALGLHLAPKRF